MWQTMLGLLDFKKKNNKHNVLITIDLIGVHVWQHILELLDFKTQMRWISSCRYFWYNLYITNLYDIDYKYLNRLSDDILKYWIFRNVIQLNANNNEKITDVSHMKSLKRLGAGRSSCIDQQGITGLDLIELDASSNNKITDFEDIKNSPLSDIGFSA